MKSTGSSQGVHLWPPSLETTLPSSFKIATTTEEARGGSGFAPSSQPRWGHVWAQSCVGSAPACWWVCSVLSLQTSGFFPAPFLWRTDPLFRKRPVLQARCFFQLPMNATFTLLPALSHTHCGRPCGTETLHWSTSPCVYSLVYITWTPCSPFTTTLLVSLRPHRGARVHGTGLSMEYCR